MTGTVSSADPRGDVRASGQDGLAPPRSPAWKFWERPPALVFHLVLLVPTLLGLWSASSPARVPWATAVAIGSLVLLAATWAYLVVTHRVATRRRWGWLVIAPAGGMVVIGLLAANLPLETRFALSKDAFEAIVPTLTTPPETEQVETPTIGGPEPVDTWPQRLGSYEVVAGWRTPDGVAVPTRARAAPVAGTPRAWPSSG